MTETIYYIVQTAQVIFSVIIGLWLFTAKNWRHEVETLKAELSASTEKRIAERLGTFTDLLDRVEKRLDAGDRRFRYGEDEAKRIELGARAAESSLVERIHEYAPSREDFRAHSDAVFRKFEGIVQKMDEMTRSLTAISTELELRRQSNG